MAIIVKNLAERVFDIIRERIVSGELPVGEAVRQDVLASELGISKIPLREALVRLEQDGLLHSHPNRGWFVRAMSAEAAEEIYDLRLAIEPDAAAIACLLADEEEQRAVSDAFDALERAVAGNIGDAVKCNRDFHIMLISPCRRSLTIKLIGKLGVLAERYVLAHLTPEGRGDRAQHEHKELRDAWLARDADRVRALLVHHIEGTRDDLRAHFMKEHEAA